MGYSNNNWAGMTDNAIIKALGQYIKNYRLEINKTQAKVAAEAGINRWTLSQLENGEPVTLLSFIQILRALDLLHLLVIFKTEKKISPIALAKLEQKQRQRARPGNTDNNIKSSR